MAVTLSSVRAGLDDGSNSYSDAAVMADSDLTGVGLCDCGILLVDCLSNLPNRDAHDR